MRRFFLLLLALASDSAFSQSSTRFTIGRNVISGGGMTFSSSARFGLGSTIAQPLAAVPSSARFSIQGGFWIWPASIIFAPTKVGENFVFLLQTEPGKTYGVTYAGSLPATNWQTVTNIVGDGTIKTVTNSTSSSPQGFFRVIEK